MSQKVRFYVKQSIIWVLLLAFGISLRPEPTPVRALADVPPDLSADLTGRFLFSARRLPAYRYHHWFPIREIRAFLKARMRDVSPSQIPILAQHLVNLSRYYQVDPAFILSVIDVESSFRLRAVSSAGAVGLMQLMPATAGLMLRDSRLPFRRALLEKLRHSRVRSPDGQLVLSHRWLMDPFVNLTLGVAYLASLRKRYHGHPFSYLVTAYNVGPARLEELVSQNHLKWVKCNPYVDAVSRRFSELKRRNRENLLAKKL